MADGNVIRLFGGGVMFWHPPNNVAGSMQPIGFWCLVCGGVLV
ncbi:hypothetical protein ACN4EG_14990 [Alkalinema pantanalense CENA528]